MPVWRDRAGRTLAGQGRIALWLRLLWGFELGSRKETTEMRAAEQIQGQARLSRFLRPRKTCRESHEDLSYKESSQATSV